MLIASSIDPSVSLSFLLFSIFLTNSSLQALVFSHQLRVFLQRSEVVIDRTKKERFIVEETDETTINKTHQSSWFSYLRKTSQIWSSFDPRRFLNFSLLAYLSINLVDVCFYVLQLCI